MIFNSLNMFRTWESCMRNLLVYFLGEKPPAIEPVAHVPKPPMVENYIDGPLKVEKVTRYDPFDVTRKTTGEAVVISVEDAGSDNKKFTYLTLNCENGSTRVTFPHEFSLPERTALIGRRVSYSEDYGLTWEGSGLGDLEGCAYRLRVLDGPIAGWEISVDEVN